jgi:hypothetical protein
MTNFCSKDDELLRYLTDSLMYGLLPEEFMQLVS